MSDQPAQLVQTGVLVGQPRELFAWRVVHSLPGRVRLRVPALLIATAWQHKVKTTLNKTVGVRSVRINQAACSMTIQYDPEIESALKLLLLKLEERCGCQCDESLVQFASLHSSSARSSKKTLPPISLKGQTPKSQTPKSQTSEAHADQTWAGLKLPVLAAGLAVLSRYSWPLELRSGLRSLSALALLGAVLPVGQRAFRSLSVHRKFNIDCLDLLALSLSAWQGKLLTPALVLTLHELGDTIREQTARTTAVQSSSLEDTIGHFAWVKLEADAPPQQIPSDQVQIGQTVVVYPGEQIPVDGSVLVGKAIIDQQSLTGEAMPIAGRSGTQVYASTLVRSGQIQIRAERVGRNTRAAVGLELLRQAPVYDTRMANYAEQVADRLIVPSLLLAGVVLLTTGDTARTAAILTLDFVTGIRVSIPMAFLGALNHTTRHGVLIRSGRTLEKIAEVDTIVFDKTGTLTQGQITVVDIQPFNDEAASEHHRQSLNAAEILQVAASAEQRINHPVAAAIAQYAQAQNLPMLSREHWSYEVGLGIKAQIEGRSVLVGSERFLRQYGVDWAADWTANVITPETAVDSLIYVACEGQFWGTIRYSDPLRSESTELIKRLHKEYGIKVYLLTGDNPQRAMQVANTLGISQPQVYAEAFPEQKAQIIQELHRAGRTVAFVGDGLNDSIALAYADVSVSFARGAEVARETADVVLMENNLLDFLEIIAISRQTQHLIEQNIGLVVLPNLIALGIATTQGLRPLIATGIHNGSAIAAGLNSLRPLLQHRLNPKRMAS
ncbi:cadmium-translocating P-type ATPase [Synechococcus sp. PCC 7335]|uniref:heavy metal translocating P-type ATPase n=1 Tax=Synechococcus sp. (strain ATCC 29403 / PCC 7335) TaxID=91464 RepID=UPI00017EBC8C|nr:heavy metal translocating P-type ATPase [Synechococcus sp. PCC 7335]EDX87019.1 cadmium-translocating P-type ATPase [Synechococcus sp. PCC 7335]